jgi:hypothetical protein
MQEGRAVWKIKDKITTKQKYKWNVLRSLKKGVLRV